MRLGAKKHHPRCHPISKQSLLMYKHTLCTVTGANRQSLLKKSSFGLPSKVHSRTARLPRSQHPRLSGKKTLCVTSLSLRFVMTLYHFCGKLSISTNKISVSNIFCQANGTLLPLQYGRHLSQASRQDRQ